MADTLLDAGDASSTGCRIFLGTATWVEKDARGLHGKHTVLLIFTETVCSKTIKIATFSTEVANHILYTIKKVIVTSTTSHHFFKLGVVLGFREIMGF